jgi:predicted nucleotidyltransferase
MEDNLIENVLRVCAALKKHNVDYLIVGGTALAFHGHYRMTRMSNDLPTDKHDFDFWYSPSYENYFKLLNALEELGINVTEFRSEQVPNPKKLFFTHDFEEFKVDFLPEISGLDRFSKSFATKATSVVRGTEIYILSKKDLIKSKEKIGRKKDQDDINELRALEDNE